MPTIGTDCDITLTQATVNGGAPVGFLLRRPPRAEQLGGMLAITRRTAANGDGTFSDLVTFTMTILAATGMRNPNHTIHAASRAGAYASFLAFLAARTGITLTCAAGTFTNLQATQTPATEIYTYSDTLSLHDALPISRTRGRQARGATPTSSPGDAGGGVFHGDGGD